jgi:hypothetical protein
MGCAGCSKAQPNVSHLVFLSHFFRLVFFKQASVVNLKKKVKFATNALGAHAQGCVANDVMLLSTLKALALCARSLHNTRNA